MVHNRLNLTGQRFGMLTVNKSLGNKKKNSIRMCKCDCGREKNILGYLLHTGKRKDCGCQKNRDKITHGMGKTRFYIIFRSIYQRCYNKNNCAYKYYGLKGIICLRKSFEEFRDDMYESYLKHVEEFGEKETTIDRIDSNGNYCKENCRWATSYEQTHNRGNSLLYKGRPLSELSREAGLRYKTVRSRINVIGKDVDIALSKPTKKIYK